MEIQIRFSISPRSTPPRLHNFQSSQLEECQEAEIRILCKATEKFTEQATKIQMKMMMKSMDQVVLLALPTKRRSVRRTKRRIRRRLKMHLLLIVVSSTIISTSKGRLMFFQVKLLRMNLNKILLH